MTDPIESIESIMEKYEGLWVAVKVTERDESGQPLKGEVISKEAARSKVMDAIYKQEDICVFRAGPVPRKGYVAMF